MTAQHHALDTRDHLLAIVRLWPELEARLAAGGGTGGSEIRTASGSRAPINAGVSDVIAEVTVWANFLARVLLDETDWTPPAVVTVPILLERIARDRLGHFTEHPDDGLRLAFEDEAVGHRRAVETAARPSGVRTLRIGVACIEAGCSGQYVARADPAAPYVVPDLVCSRAREHTIDPVTWQRAYRRAGGDLDRVRDILVTQRAALTSAV